MGEALFSNERKKNIKLISTLPLTLTLSHTHDLVVERSSSQRFLNGAQRRSRISAAALSQLVNTPDLVVFERWEEGPI